VFKVAAFGPDASVKMSSPLLSAYAVSITLWSNSSHADTAKVTFEQIVCGIIRTTTR